MAEQIECVGGPLDGESVTVEKVNPVYYVPRTGPIMADVPLDEIVKEQPHIYIYNPTTNTYEYKGVRK